MAGATSFCKYCSEAMMSFAPIDLAAKYANCSCWNLFLHASVVLSFPFLDKTMSVAGVSVDAHPAASAPEAVFQMKSSFVSPEAIKMRTTAVRTKSS